MPNPSTGAANPLEQLRDIHLPDPISPWTLALGWWILIFAGGLLAGGLIAYCYRRHRANLYRRQATEQLKKLHLLGNSQHQLPELIELLKQTANSAYPERHPSSYSIERFIRFLQYSCDRAVFDDLNLDMDKALYSNKSSNQTSEQIDELFDDAKIWIKEHME